MKATILTAKGQESKLEKGTDIDRPRGLFTDGRLLVLSDPTYHQTVKSVIFKY